MPAPNDERRSLEQERTELRAQIAGDEPDVLDALVAFVAEHLRCGDLDGRRDSGYVWLACSCGACIAHPASAHPQHRH